MSDRNGHAETLDWRDVTAAHPCLICQKADWCRRTPRFACCRREKHHPVYGDGKRKVDQSGAEYHVFCLEPSSDGDNKWPEPTCSHTDNGGQLADADQRNKVYSRFLELSSLHSDHREHLDGRKFPLKEAERLGLRSLNQRRVTIVAKMIRDGMEKQLPGVPGFYVNEKDGKRYWSFGGPAGLLIPVKDAAGRIVALLLRPDKARSGTKYIWCSTKRRGGAGPGTPTNCPPFEGSRERIRITEGAIKSLIATLLSGDLTIGLSSVNNWRRATRVLHELGAKVVAVAFDADWRTNRNVAGHLVALVKRLREDGFEVELELWDAADGKGIDDLLAAGKQPDVRKGEDVDRALVEVEKAAQAKSAGNTTGQDNPTGQYTVLVTTHEHEVVAQCITGLALKATEVYKRGGQLVHLVRDSRPAGDRDGREKIERPVGAPRIAPLPLPKLRTLLTRDVQLIVQKETDEGVVEVRVHPPEWLPKAIDAQADWPGIWHLEAIAEAPFLRKDGTLVQTPGYDLISGVLYEPVEEFAPIPDNPTRDDAIRASDELLETVVDFPFGSPVYRAVFIVALLTLLARFAFEGPSPLFFVSANVRGAGKGLLLDIIAYIVFGRPFPRVAYTREDDEMRKVILSLAIEGERAVLLDNIAGTFGGPALDAALTSSWWSGRLLGKNQQIRLPLLATWYATGNNPVIGADTARRVCECRLESAEERPEERQGFRHPDVLGWVKAERPRLLMAALTILAAYCRAGRPDMGLTPWGSFEGWSALVRSAVVWVGLPDPGETRRELASRADIEAGALAGLLAGWLELDPQSEGVTTSAALEKLGKNPDSFAALRTVLAEMYELPPGQLPPPRRLGNTLRRHVGRNIGGRCFDNRPGHGGVAAWFVRNMNQAAGAAGSGGCGGFGGSAPPTPSAHAHTCAHAHTGDGGNRPTTPTTPTNTEAESDSDEHGDAWEG